LRTVRFFFTRSTDGAPGRALVEEILRSLSRGDALDVDGEVLAEGRKVLGLAISGEHELVSMARERVRRALKSNGIGYREEESSDRTDEETDAHSFLTRYASSPGRPEPAPENASEEAEGEEEEYEEYDLEELTRAEYGQYPLTGHARIREHQKRKQEQDAVLRAARERVALDAELTLPRRKPMSAEERKRLAFTRGMKSGIAFYRLGLYADAERNLSAAVKADRGEAEAHFYLALVYDQLGKPELAEKHFRRAITIEPEVGANHFYLANTYQKQGKLDKAILEYKRSIERDPDIPIVYNNLAWVFFQEGDHERALRAFEQAIGIDSDLPFPHNGLACVYQELGAFPDAVTEFRKAIELYPDYAAAHLKLGWCLLQLGELDPAIEEFKAVLSSSEDSEYVLSANYSLGHSFLAEGRLLEAQEAFQKVVAAEDDEFLDALLHLGIIQLRLGFARQAVALLRRYLRKAGESASEEAWRYMAHAYFQADQYAAAMRACRRALEHDGDDPDVYELMGQIAGSQEHWSAAERHLRKALEINRDAASSWFHLGWVFENKGDRAQAAQAFRNAIQRDPEGSDAYHALGRLYTEEGRREEALVLFEKALELAPTDANILNSLGWLYAQLGSYEEALGCYTRALQAEPESAMLRANVGALYLQMGRREDAERELRLVLELDSDEQATANAHYFLGILARSRQNARKVIEHMEQALLHDANLGAAWFRLGESMLEEGDLAQARRALERYLDLEPQGEFAGLARQYVLERLSAVTTPKPPIAGVTTRPSSRRKKKSVSSVRRAR
jgi:tetratricopeptide (TPR) repeat protein